MDHMVNNSLDTTETVTNAYLQRLAAQDADGIGELFADEIDWFVPGDSALPWTGRRTRGSDVADYFRAMWPAFEAGKSVTAPGKLIISGEDAVIFADFTHTAASTGRVFQTPVTMHLTVTGGKIVGMHLYEDTLAVATAFAA